MKKVFVSGGSGFVGRNLIRALIKQGCCVRALARSESARQSVIALGAEAVAGDLDHAGHLSDAVAGCDTVFHAAALVTEWGPRQQFEAINVDGTRRLLAAARAARVTCFVHISTEACFADGSPLINIDETRPIPAQPLPRYPASKARAEQLVLAANAPGFRTIALRPRLIWGGDDSSLLPQIVAAVRLGRFAWINGGRHLTSTCHIDNVVEGCLQAAQHGRGGEAYFLSDGAPVQFRRFLSDLLATQGVDGGNRSLPRSLAWAAGSVCEFLWETLRLPGSPPATRMVANLFGQEVTVNDAKARRELGYAGLTTVETGLAALRSTQT